MKTEALIACEFKISRTFDAPRDLVWKAFTEPERLMHWWGPAGFTMLSAKVELTPDGVFHYGMKSPDGIVMWGKWTYWEIVPPEKLVTIVSFSDESGGITIHPWNPDWPREMISTMTLVEEGGRTTITITAIPYNGSETEIATFNASHDSMEQGFSGTLGQLTTYLASAPKEGS